MRQEKVPVGSPRAIWSHAIAALPFPHLKADRPRATVILVMAAVLALAASPLVAPAASAQTSPCAAGSRPIVCENSKPGNDRTEWDVSAAGDPTLEGFSTDISVNAGGTVHFKIRSTASAYTMNVYRSGYYGGLGARKVATISPSVSLPQTQPECQSDPDTTGLIDCGNWAETASWAVPADAVSGIYFVKLERADTGSSSHITFIVRNDSSHSDIIYQTSDMTWQAYNTFGNSLYGKDQDTSPGVPAGAGRAYKVSYNRPFETRHTSTDGRDFYFSAEYPMVRWMEANGYDVTYSTGIDSDRAGALIKNHKTFMSSGHDEYWSGNQRANVESARDAGVNLAFFSGNEVFWKTRWEDAWAGPANSYRTLVTYKETKADAKIDPDAAWTGTWRDPRLSPPSDGGRPENALTGQFWKVNSGSAAIQVPQQDGLMRLWRNTSVATQAAGGVATFSNNTLGYEWDEDTDNATRPAGQIELSTTSVDNVVYLIDYGYTLDTRTATHHLTEYKAPSGALVFGAGTVQWAWGLDDHHDGIQAPIDQRMQQATVNILADMGAQPGTLQAGLVTASPSADTTRPVSSLSSPTPGAQVANGAAVTIQGTASDVGGRVGGVEVSTDNGVTWHPAQGRTNWSYVWNATGSGAVTIKARATDDSLNTQATPASMTVNVNCPCTLWGPTAPTSAPLPTNPPATPLPLELGTRFTTDINGWISGVRFYKSPEPSGNYSHTVSLWTPSGTRLANGTINNADEVASGWQTVQFASAVPVVAGGTYIASYYTPTGRYYGDTFTFAGVSVNAPPLHGPADSTSAHNGVFKTDSPGFPDRSAKSTNYWVDPVLVTTPPPDTTKPFVTAITPASESSSVPVTTPFTATFSEPVTPASISFVVKDPSNNTVPGTTTYDAPSMKATFTPTSLAPGVRYTAAVSGATDPSGNIMNPSTPWSITTANANQPPGVCPCSLWTDSTVPAVANVNDPKGVELGVKFKADADGFITGVRFYKGPGIGSQLNGGTHVGSVWTTAATPALLASATFTGESSSGWQQVNFSTPVQITAGNYYVASYYAPQGLYAANVRGFQTTGVDNGQLHAPKDATPGVGGNGVYKYATSSGAGNYPSSSSNSSNYWVDVVYQPAADVTGPVVTSTTPTAGLTNVAVNIAPRAVFDEPVQPATIAFTLSSPSGNIAGSVAYAAGTKTTTFTPTAPLAGGVTYTATVSGAKDQAGNLMASPKTWTFTTAGTCPCTIFDDDQAPQSPSTADNKAVEVGMKFKSDTNGFVTGVRFYKGAGNTAAPNTRTGHLWAANGTSLGSATFGAESATGWQTVTFPTPIAITAGTTYIVSYYAPAGHYAGDSNVFATAGIDNGPLHALANSVSANGVYLYAVGGGFPASSYKSTNYWVDVVFTP